MRLASVLALVMCLFTARADEVDRLLLVYGYHSWNDIQNLLLSRSDLIQDDLVWAETAPEWRTRMMAAVVQAKISNLRRFTRETARIRELRAIYLRAVGIEDPPPEPALAIGLRSSRTEPSIAPLTAAIRQRLGPPPNQHIPWTVLADAIHAPYAPWEQHLLILLHFWADPQEQLLPLFWNGYANEDGEIVLEQAIFALGNAAIPLLKDDLQNHPPSHQKHPGLAPRILDALGDRSCWPLYREWLLIPNPPRIRGEEDRTAMFMHANALAGMEILAQHGDAEALPLLVERLSDYLVNHRDIATCRFSSLGSDRPACDDHFPDDADPTNNTHYRFHVDRMAGAIACYGTTAVPLLHGKAVALAAVSPSTSDVKKQRRQNTIDTLDALVGVIEANDEASRHVAGLRWNLARSHDLGVLLDLRRATGESVAGFVAQHGWFATPVTPPLKHPEVILERLRRLSACGDRALIPIIAAWGSEVRATFMRQAEALEQLRGPGSFDPQLLREQQEAVFSADTPTALLIGADETIMALIRLGGADAATALAEAAKQPPWSALADAGRLALDGNIRRVVARIDSNDLRQAEAAAQVLGILGDTRAQMALIRGAARRRGISHARWLTLARSLGPFDAIIAEVTALKSGDLRLRILAAAIADEVAHPEATVSRDADLYAAAESVSMMHTWGTSLIVSTGQHVVTSGQFDAAARPLLEARCLFGTGVILRGVAANALAAIGDERSLPVIAESADMGAAGGSNPVVPALEAFGKRGATFAAAVPKLIPAQADTGMRVTAHRYGTQVLAELGDVRAIEQILDGFRTLFADPHLEGWSQRMRVYLQASANCKDDRLIEPLLQAAQNQSHESEALGQLSRYHDPRCEAALVAAFTRGNPFDDRKEDANAYMGGALVHYWGDEAPRHFAALAADNDPVLSARALRALAELSISSLTIGLTWPDDYPNRDALARTTREIALPLLTAAINNPDATIQAKAAQSLVAWIGGSAEDHGEINGKIYVRSPRIVGDARGIPLLNNWLRTGGEPNFGILYCLGREGNADTAVILLNLLTLGPEWISNHRPDMILSAIGRMHPPGAIEALETLAQESPGAKSDAISSEAVNALSLCGEKGLAILNRLQATSISHQRRARIASLLADAGALDLAMTLTHLQDCLVAADAEEFKKRYDKPERIHAWTCQSLFSALMKQDREAGRLALVPMLTFGTDDIRATAVSTAAFRLKTMAH